MKHSRPILMLLLAAMFAALGLAQRKEERVPVLFKAPAVARGWQNPYEGQPDALRAGEKLFRRYCADCHGADAHGIGRAANLRSAAVQNASIGELVWFLRNGDLAVGMPSWSRLPEQQRWQLATYLKSLSSAAAEPSPQVPR